VLFHWRWWYHVPSLPLWAIVFLLLVVPKANRHRQAWLIVIPLGLVLLVWRMPATLLSWPDESTERLGFFVVSGAMAWSMVWLLGRWLGTRYRIITMVFIWAVMFAIGLVSFYCHFADAMYLAPYLILYGVGVGILLLAMMFTANLCRRTFSAAKFLGWLLLWNVVVIVGLMMVYGALIMIVQPSLRNIAAFAVIIIPVTLLLGSILYLPSLPFLILALRCPFYRERFEKLFHIEKTPEAVPGSPLAMSPLPPGEG